MPKRNDENIFFDDEEDEDIEDPVAIREGSDEEESEDDEEANEDLSLKILEKALSRRDSDDSKETSMSDLYGSGVVSTVMVNGEKSKGNNKMKKRTNLEDEEISIVAKDKAVEKMVEDSIKREEDDDEKSAEPSSNLVLKKLLRGARYFDPPDAGWVSCYSCGEQGHITVNCPTPTKRRKPCFICGSLEHGAKQCSKGHDCYICKKSGHRARDCPDKYKSGAKTAVCLRCGDFGHDMILCNYEYSRDDLKDIQCYVCKRFGHLCCVEPGNSPTWAVSCYRCGQLGHIGLACGRYYEESTEKDSASSCFRCGEEGHLPSLCFRCYGEGHFARECPNSSQVGSISLSPFGFSELSLSLSLIL
uniref:DNA-binding protein HEXBP n=1 Tax=Noccaea caerulescens TaxID=107243 RepID=A0A1J3EM29_NOCCA